MSTHDLHAAAPSLHPTRFRDLEELARLPWFVRDERGGLALRPGACGPILDLHTHLALSFFLPSRLDLRREWETTEHYLPARRALDLDVYANRNFSQADLLHMRLDLGLGGFTRSGMRRTHTVPNLAREMAQMGVACSLLLAIDFPIVSANSEAWLDATRGDESFVCFGSVHPHDPDPEGRIDALVARGARGIKVHPTVQGVAPDSERSLRIYELCGRRGLPIFFHCGPVGIEGAGGRRRTQVERYRRALADHPDTVFVLGHSGALQPEVALDLHRSHDNAWLELSSQGLPTVRRILAAADPARVCFGSDWPFYHQALPLAKVLIATERDARLRHRVLWENAARLLGLPARAHEPAGDPGASA